LKGKNSNYPKKENRRLKELVANIDRKYDEQRIAIPLTDNTLLIHFSKSRRFKILTLNYEPYYAIKMNPL
jgi:two-component system, LytTR family, response regulator